MPYITAQRREAKRAEIVAAARRCFSRRGFHQTSMPDIAAEAGVAVGGTYRYFSGKEELILEIAGDAFRLIFEPVEGRIGGPPVDVTVADLVARAVGRAADDAASVDAGGRAVPAEELLRCAVQAWGELLTHEGLRQRALEGLDLVRRRMAETLRRGQAAGTVPLVLDPERTTRVVVALLHGFVLQRAAFGLDDTQGFIADVRALLTEPPAEAAGPSPSPGETEVRSCSKN